MSTSRNVRGGKSNRKLKKTKEDNSSSKIQLPSKSNEQIAIITKKVGGNCIELIYFEPIRKDFVKTNTLIPGKFYKRVYMNPGDFVLIEYNEKNANECLILCKYNENQHRQLKQLPYFDSLYKTYYKDTDGKTAHESDEEELVFDDQNQNEDIDLDDL